MIKKLMHPAGMGVAMGLMMLWMIHGQITDGGGPVLWFVALHVLVVLGLLAFAVWAARFAPHLRARLHVPSLAHMRGMAVGMLCVATVACSFCATHWLLFGRPA